MTAVPPPFAEDAAYQSMRAMQIPKISDWKHLSAFTALETLEGQALPAVWARLEGRLAPLRRKVEQSPLIDQVRADMASTLGAGHALDVAEIAEAMPVCDEGSAEFFHNLCGFQTAPPLTAHGRLLFPEAAAADKDASSLAFLQPGGSHNVWLLALRNALVSVITDEDAAVLRHLTDIRSETVGDGADVRYKLHFAFGSNPHFAHERLTLTLKSQPRYGVEENYFATDATCIEWTSPKFNPTIKKGEGFAMVKQGTGSRLVTKKVPKYVPVTSFFRMFTSVDDDSIAVDDEGELGGQIDAGTIGAFIRSHVVPNPIAFAIGEQLPPDVQDDDDGDLPEDDPEFDEDAAEGEEELEEEEEDDDAPKRAAPKQDCKQQ